MTEGQAEHNGWLEVEYDEERECQDCGEPSLDGWHKPATGEFICDECLAEREE